MRKTFPSIILTLVLTSILWNCKEERIQTETEFEQSVFYEIFPSILDSIYHDRRVIPPPPPSPDFFDKYDSNNLDKAIEDYKKTEKFKQGKKKWEKTKDSLNQDKSPIYLAVSDYMSRLEKEDTNELIKHFKNENINLDSSDIISKKGFKIDLNKLNSNNKKIKFKYRSEFPKGREFWRTEYEFYVGAKIGFSQILFDESKTYGIINAGFGTGILNGNGCRIFIRKSNNGKWIIDKVIGTRIS